MDEDEVPAYIQQNVDQQNQVERKFIIHSKVYYYRGPNNQETSPLILLLTQMDVDSKSKENNIFLQFYEKYQNFELNYVKKCILLKGNFTFDLNEILKIIVYWSAFLSVVGETMTLKDQEILENNQTRQQIMQYMPLYAFLYTFFSEMQKNIYSRFQQIQSKILWAILFVTLIIIPGFVFFGYHFNLFNQTFKFSGDYIGIAFCITSFAIFINSLLNKILFFYFSKAFNTLIATLFNCSFCILISYFILFKIITCVLLLNSFSIDIVINSIGNIIGPSLFILLTLIGIILIRQLFQINPKCIIQELQLLSVTAQPEKAITELYKSYSLNQKISVLFQNAHLIKLSKCLILICYAVLELLFYANLLIELEAEIVDLQLIITYSVLLLAPPIYLIIGIGISNQKNSITKTYFHIPFYFAIGLSIISIKFWSVTNENKYLKHISRLIGISPLLISIIWLTIAYFRNNRRAQRMMIMLISCVFFALPLGILLTLKDLLDDQNIQIGFLILFVIGCIPIVIVIGYYIFVSFLYLIKLPRQAQRQDFEAYKYVNLKNYALWINAVFYLISFFSICYFVINEPANSTGTKKGTMIGLLVIHTILFMQTSIILKKQIYEKYGEKVDQMKGYKQFSLFGIIFPLITLLPISLLLYNQNRVSETTEIALLSISVGVPLCFCYFLFQIKTKQNSVSFQNFLLPLLTVLIWIFFVGPIGVIFPIFADIYENSTEEFATFAQLAVAYTLLICILYVTLSSIFYSVLLNKEYQEMKKKEVLKVVMALLIENKISCEEDVCAFIYLRYIQQNDPITLKTNLIQGDPVNVVDYPGEDKGKKFDFLLVVKSDYEARIRLKQIQEQKKKQSQIRSEMNDNSSTTQSLQNQKSTVEQEGCGAYISDILYQCLFCKYGSYELKQYNVQEQRLKKQLQKLEQQNSSIGNTNEQFTVTLRNDFFIALRNQQPDRAERFWFAVYQVFQNDFSTILDYLKLEQDDGILQSQYKSYQVINETNFNLSIEDFALLLFDNFQTENHINYKTILQEQALKYYEKFNLNHHKMLSDVYQKRNSDTPFHSFNPPPDCKGQRKKLRSLDNPNVKAQILRPSKCKLKLWECCHYVHEQLWVKPILFTQKLMGQLADIFFPKIQLDTQQIVFKNEKWEIVADKVGDKLVNECKKFDAEMDEKENNFNITITNIQALLTKIFDVYSLATLAFDPQVGWFVDDQTFNPIETIDYSAIWDEYTFFFVLALLMSVAYFFLGMKASQDIKNNTYGFDDKLQVATWKSLSFWLTKSIQFISGQFIFVMKTYIDSVICDYSQYPYTLIRESNVECMSDVHFIYVVFAIFGCGIYFPLSTYLQPTFQYMDHSLDLKYKSSYVVILNQGKLLILGMSSVFINFQGKAYTYQMLFSSFVMFLIMLFQKKSQPCYVKWFNILEFGMLCQLSIFYFGAFLIMVTTHRLAGLLFVLTLSIINICLTGFFLFKKYQEISKNKINPTTQDQDESQLFQNQ